METGDSASDNTELGRLASVAAAMARSREACRSGRGQIRTVLDARGIGDWSGAPRAVRSVALACRLCRDDETHRAFSRLVLHVEAHAGRLLHRWSADRCGDAVFALLRLAERHAGWRRGPEGWHPATATALMQFG